MLKYEGESLNKTGAKPEPIINLSLEVDCIPLIAYLQKCAMYQDGCIVKNDRIDKWLFKAFELIATLSEQIEKSKK